MPNHITNRLEIIGEKTEVDKVLDFIKVEENNYDNEVHGVGTIDFNKITPMPKWVYGSNPDIIGISLEDEKKYGKENTFVSWARSNWGTKWNAYGLIDDRTNNNVIYFLTAWNGVPDLIQKLAWIFPNVKIKYSWCDENIGYNLGTFIFQDTETLEKYIPKYGSKEAYELVFDIEQDGPEYFGFKLNSEIDNYEYCGCLEDDSE